MWISRITSKKTMKPDSMRFCWASLIHYSGWGCINVSADSDGLLCSSGVALESYGGTWGYLGREGGSWLIEIMLTQNWRIFLALAAAEGHDNTGARLAIISLDRSPFLDGWSIISCYKSVWAQLLYVAPLIPPSTGGSSVWGSTDFTEWHCHQHRAQE